MKSTISIPATSLVFVGALVWCSCSSPLSDVPISEPSVLRAVAVAERDIGVTNGITSFLQLSLRDKHEEWVELKEGNVTVNGLAMSYDGWGSYVRNDAVQPDANYTYKITLSDGSKYSCQVHTPKDLHQFDVPSEYDRKSPLTLTWQESDGAAQARIDLADASQTFSYYPYASAGSYTLQPSAFDKFQAGATIRVTLTFTTNGSADPRLMSTSTAYGSFSISRNLLLR